MKKLLFAICFCHIALFFIVGCNSPTDEVSYSRTDKELKLKITHRNGGNSCSVELTNKEEAEKYKLRLEKLIREIDDFERDLLVREKN